MSKNRTGNPNIASSRIDFLEKDEIFVFGSNLEGKHLGGAAKAAHMKFGLFLLFAQKKQANLYKQTVQFDVLNF